MGTFEKAAISAFLKNGLDEYSVSFSYLLKEAIVFNGEITTPFSGYKTLMASYDYNGNLGNFRCIGKLKIERVLSVLNLKMNTDNLRNMTCSLDISSPYMYLSPIYLKVRNEANARKYHSVFDFRRNSQKTFGLSSFASTYHKKKEFSLSPTWNDIKHEVLDFTYSRTGFVISSEVVIRSKWEKVEITFSQLPKLIATFILKSENFPMIHANLDMVRTPSYILGGCELDVGGMRSGLIRVLLNSRDKFATTFSIELPFKAYREFSGNFSFVPGEDAFTIDAKMTKNFLKLFEVSTSFETNNIGFFLESNIPHPHSARVLYSNVNQKIKMSCELFNASKKIINGNIDLTTEFNPLYITGLITIDIQVVETSKFKLPGKNLKFTVFSNDRQSKADLSWGMKPENKVGYEITVGDYYDTLKLRLPSQSLLFSASHRGHNTEGSFMWDADVDQTKKVTVQSRIETASDMANASIVIMMPFLGKNVYVGSEISVNQRRAIFYGNTVLSYSRDFRKKLVLTSKFEDISIRGSQNYSLSFGMSHPYTTVGVMVNNHVGRSKNGYSAGVALEYITIKKVTKKFFMGAKIDKLMRAVIFEIQSPVRSISISGSAPIDDNFRLSLLNIFDQKQPMSTTFTFDPSARSIDFVTNFDDDKPRDEFHLNMKYVNSSAISTEVYHIVRREKVRDVLVTAQLNTSHILHSRIHWRPEMMKDLDNFMEDRKLEDYPMRLRKAPARIELEIVDEVTEKSRKIWDAAGEEIGEENIATFKATIEPYLDLALANTIAISKSFLQRKSVLLMLSRNINMRRYPVTFWLLSKSLDSERPISLKKAIPDKFKFISEQMKWPAKHIPNYVRSIMSDALNYTTEHMPTAVASQIIVLRPYASKLIDAMESFIKAEILAFEKEAETKLRKIEVFPFTVYDPAQGDIQIELYSVIPIKSLDSLPSLNLQNLLSSFLDVTVPYITEEWMLPFTGVASVSYGDKITTFDGYVYDLNTDCTYILSRDYMDGNFTLVLSNDGYTTLIFLTSGKPVSINSQGKILLNGKPATVPFSEDYITVNQGRNGVVTIKGGNHFSVDYDLTIDHMKIQISGWYHGRTGGLLGIYDNEPSNDKMTSFNKVVENNGRFARTWEVATNSC